ncbi:MAG: TolC family protein [Chitinophagales bacterium]
MKKSGIVWLALMGYLSGFSQKLELHDAVNLALKNSLDIQISTNNVDIAKINNYIGIAGGLPLISAVGTDNFFISGVNQKLNTGEVIKREGSNANNLSGNLTASILLYNGHRVFAAKKRLEQLETQSRDQLNSIIQNIMASVMTAYFDVIRQQGYNKTIDLAIEVARRKLEIVKTQQGVGLANNADLFQSQVDLNNLIQSKVTQQLVIDQAKSELLRMLTLRPDSVILVEDSIMVDKSLKLDEVQSRLTLNPDILAADDQININQMLIKETAAQRYPTIRASTGYSYSGNNASAGQLLLNQSYGPFVGLSLNIPIYNGSIYKRQQKIAEINSLSATVQKDLLLRDYRANIVKTYQAYTATLQQLETQQSNYQLASQLLALVLQRFQYRQATIVDVAQAQQSYITAAYSLVNYSFVAKSAEIELKRISFRLSP